MTVIHVVLWILLIRGGVALIGWFAVAFASDFPITYTRTAGEVALSVVGEMGLVGLCALALWGGA